MRNTLLVKALIEPPNARVLASRSLCPLRVKSRERLAASKSSPLHSPKRTLGKAAIRSA
jgi:hypothetical protein